MFITLVVGFSVFTFARLMKAVIAGDSERADLCIILFIAGNFFLILAQKGFSH